MTLVVRDERDIVEQHLAFHLAAGVDEVIVTDHASTDGTEDVLARYERDGRVTRAPRARRAVPPARMGHADGAPGGDASTAPTG